METSSMDPDRGAVAPHEPNRGARRPGSRTLRSVPLFGAPNGAHQKIERRAENLFWMAVAQWVDAITNRMMVLAVG